jgi:nucleoid-associated protein YgaU
MAKDAKLGLVVGIGVVIVIAVVFFRKEPVTAQAPTGQAALNPAGLLPAIPSPERADKLSARVAAGSEGPSVRGRRHTVQAGETLFSLALHYYKDGARFVDIYRTNQEVLRTPDRLEPGTVLVIPGLPE